MVGSPLVAALGLCVPDTCSSFDMTVLLADVAKRMGIQYQIGADCHSQNKTLDTKAVVAIVLCSILLLCIVVGTAVDVVLQRREKRRQEVPHVSTNGHSPQDEQLPLLVNTSTPTPPQSGLVLKVLVAFSVYTNGSKLLSTRQQAGSLNCVHGIRFLSMTWVVLGHGFLFSMSVGENVGPYMQEFLKRWSSQAISNALVAVDSFFVLSGLLVSYLTLKELQKKNGKLNWFMFYFHRFWRLTPAYMLVIMVYLCLSPYWGDGPVWPASDPDRDNCEDNWWTNLLYLNNFINVKEMCLGQSWYLANDMQFYCVLSPLVILPLYYFPVAGYVVSAVLVLAHCVVSAALTMHNIYPPGMFAQVKSSSPPDMASWGPDFYMKPYTRWGPYVIGMMAGYFLYINKCKLNIKWYVNSLLWAVATAAALAVLYGLYGASTGDPMTLSMSAFYNAMNRNVWGACLSWVIIACVTGNGGFVDTLLSWPGFMPLSRLTYCIYLLHILIMDIYLFNSRSLFYFSDINIVMFFLSVIIVSYMAAAVTSLAFEAPMMALEKVMFSRDGPRNNNQPKQEQYPEGQDSFYTKSNE